MNIKELISEVKSKIADIDTALNNTFMLGKGLYVGGDVVLMTVIITGKIING